STATPRSASVVTLGLAQYPVSPGGLPRRGRPSGHLGVGLLVGGGGATGRAKNTRCPVRATTIDSDHACLLPSRAAIPSTVTTSPTLTVFRVHPWRRRSTVLSSSIAQFAVRPPGSATLMNTCACGLAQSTAVIAPRSVNRFALSNFAAIA